MRVLAVDPGKSTGLAYWDPGGDPEFDAFIMPYAEALKHVDRCVTYRYVDLVVCEDFVIGQRTLKAGTDGWRRGAELEFIGAVRWECHKRDVEFDLQTAADAKIFAADSKLKRIGWYTPGPDHSRDATRHLLLALTRRKLIDPAQLLEVPKTAA